MLTESSQRERKRERETGEKLCTHREIWFKCIVNIVVPFILWMWPVFFSSSVYEVQAQMMRRTMFHAELDTLTSFERRAPLFEFVLIACKQNKVCSKSTWKGIIAHYVYVLKRANDPMTITCYTQNFKICWIPSFTLLHLFVTLYTEWIKTTKSQ